LQKNRFFKKNLVFDILDSNFSDSIPNWEGHFTKIFEIFLKAQKSPRICWQQNTRAILIKLYVNYQPCQVIYFGLAKAYLPFRRHSLKQIRQIPFKKSSISVYRS